MGMFCLTMVPNPCGEYYALIGRLNKPRKRRRTVGTQVQCFCNSSLRNFIIDNLTCQ